MKKITITLFMLFSLNLIGQNFWQPMVDLAGSSRYAAVGFSIDSLGYVLCGQTSSSSYSTDMWQFNPKTNTWVSKANLPGPNIYGPSAFVINGIAYVGNGHLITGSNTNAFYKYDPVTNQWTSIASFPGSSRYGCGFFTLNGKGYVFGGTTGGTYLKDLYEYDPLTNSWSQKATLPGNERAHPVCFAIGNKAYVTSGKKAVGNYLHDTWEYNPSTNSWTQKGNLANFTRTVASGFAINGKGYCGCGVDQAGVELNDFWEFDPITGQWTQVATIAEATGRHGASSFTVNDKGYILTGLHGTKYRKDIWEYWPTNPGIGFENTTKESLFSIFPNPATDVVYINTDNLQVTNTVIFNSLGMTVFLSDNITNHINVSSFAKGIYYIILETKEQKYIRKLIIN